MAGSFTRTAEADSNLQLDTHWLAAAGSSQPAVEGTPGVSVHYQVNGQSREVFLPFRKDTYLWQGGDSGKTNDAILHLRDNRFAVALAQLDLSPLPKDAEITDATLNLRIVYVQNKGQAGVIRCSRVLVPWAEDATWLKPDHTADKTWKGMVAGQDYVSEPFTSADIARFEPVKGGQAIEIPGFADALRAWQKGTWENDGFVLSYSGPAVQVGLLSSKAHPRHTIILGGETAGSLLLVPNLPLLGRLAPKPEDILEAHPVLTIHANDKAAAAAPPQVNIYEVTPSDDGKSLAAQSEKKLLTTIPVTGLTPDGKLILPDVGKLLQTWMSAPDAPHALDIEMAGASGDKGVSVSNDGADAPSLQLTLPSYQLAQLFHPPLSPQPGVYTQVNNGHLFYNGRRLRLWGVVGAPDVSRIVDMGFNAERIWGPGAHVAYTPASAKAGEFASYTKGDKSKFDKADEHFAELKSHGLFVMFAALNDSIPPTLLLDDDSFVTKGDDWEAWKAAIKKGGNFNGYLYVDPRLQEIKKRYAQNLLTHVNPYTGRA
ncbi:MAG: hypothetical protein WDO13_01530 [Verrucomicrobiota bacterium]